MITQEQYENHDCHASPDDGCNTCAMWEQQDEVVTRLSLQALARKTKDLQKVAVRCWEMGYYSFEDYALFCQKNGLLIF